MVRLSDCFWEGLPLSCTVAVRFEVAGAVGVPEMTPVEARVSPAGRLPVVIDHV
jgi:hypothetical protein